MSAALEYERPTTDEREERQGKHSKTLLETASNISSFLTRNKDLIELKSVNTTLLSPSEHAVNH